MISLVMPSAGRDEVVLRTLDVLLGQRCPGEGFEVVLIDTGMPEAVTGTVAGERYSALELRLERLEGGPAAARNLGARLARGQVILFLDDDKMPAGDDLIVSHAELHASRPEADYAVLGSSTWTPERDVTPLMRWLEGRGGGQFGFGAVEAGPVAARTHFYTANVSVKKSLLERVGGFDERFPYAALEDIELGVRLEAAGMELDYHPELLAWHDHPIDLPESLKRARRVGRAASHYMRIHPERPHERIARPGRAKLAAARASKQLWNSIAERGRPAAVQAISWRMLHMLAYDEGLSLGLPETGGAGA